MWQPKRSTSEAWTTTEPCPGESRRSQSLIPAFPLWELAAFSSPCVWPIQLASRKPHLVKSQLPSHSEVLSQIWCVTKYVNYVAWLTSKTSRFPLISGEKCTWVVLTRQDVYRCGHAASYIVHKSVLSKTSPHAKPMCLICNECVKKYSEGR